MTRKEFIAEFAMSDSFSTKAEAERALDHALDIITEQIAQGNEVALGQKFGTFKPVQKSARTARIPGTDRTVDVPAKKAIKFAPSAALKRTIESN